MMRVLPPAGSVAPRGPKLLRNIWMMVRSLVARDMMSPVRTCPPGRVEVLQVVVYQLLQVPLASRGRW